MTRDQLATELKRMASSQVSDIERAVKAGHKTIALNELADLDRQLFKARNEAMILKRQMETATKSATVVAAATSEGHEASNDVHLYKELEAVKAERDQVTRLELRD